MICLSLLLTGCVNRSIPPVPPSTPGQTVVNPFPSVTVPALVTPGTTASAASTQTSPPGLTPTATVEPAVRFAVIGDYGLAGPAAAQVAQLITSWGPDLIITTGDNNYPDGEAATIDANIGQYYHHYIYPYLGAFGPGAERNRFFPSLGNHDWNTPGAQPYLDYFTLPGNERYYEYTWGPVHFFAVSADSREPDGVSRLSTQATWLQEHLAAATLPWKVVYFHQPPYSSGYAGSIDWMQWPFEEWGASLVLAGHDHSYERLELDGLTYIINGLGGGPIYPTNSPLPGSQVIYNETHGALLIEATADHLAGTFLTIDGSNSDQFGLLMPVKP